MGLLQCANLIPFLHVLQFNCILVLILVLEVATGAAFYFYFQKVTLQFYTFHSSLDLTEGGLTWVTHNTQCRSMLPNVQAKT